MRLLANPCHDIVRCVLMFFFASALPGATLRAQQPARKQTNTQAKNQTASSGAQLYKRYCAVCHGNDGKGTGPPPESKLGTAPPDLTTLAKRHGGKFPDAYVADVLHNGVKLPDHGSAEMPAWGKVFSSEGADPAQINVRFRNLTNYLKSLQITGK